MQHEYNTSQHFSDLQFLYLVHFAGSINYSIASYVTEKASEHLVISKVFNSGIN